MQVEWSARSLKDLARHVRYVHRSNPRAAVKIALRIREAAHLLATHPFMARAGVEAGTREWPVSGLPYLIVYVPIGDGIRIAHIDHFKQRR